MFSLIREPHSHVLARCSQSSRRSEQSWTFGTWFWNIGEASFWLSCLQIIGKVFSVPELIMALTFVTQWLLLVGVVKSWLMWLWLMRMPTQNLWMCLLKNTLRLVFWQVWSWQQLQILLWQKLLTLGSIVVKHWKKSTLERWQGWSLQSHRQAEAHQSRGRSERN